MQQTQISHNLSVVKITQLLIILIIWELWFFPSITSISYVLQTHEQQLLNFVSCFAPAVTSRSCRLNNRTHCAVLLWTLYFQTSVCTPEVVSILLTLEMRINQFESGVSNIYQRNGRPLLLLTFRLSLVSSHPVISDIVNSQTQQKIFVLFSDIVNSQSALCGSCCLVKWFGFCDQFEILFSRHVIDLPCFEVFQRKGQTKTNNRSKAGNRCFLVQAPFPWLS